MICTIKHFIFAEQIINNTVFMLTETIAITRILISALFGCAIGIERYIHKHPAGVRTFMLICMASGVPQYR